MNVDYKILKEDLCAIGIRRGDSVLIHSSYKSMGGLDGGIQTLVDALLSVIGDNGTLIVPTLTYSYVTPEKPVFDFTKTPSCVGAISEYVRCMNGAERSVHPTHSCAAIGYNASFYVKGHEIDRTPVGNNSPFYKLRQLGGKVLMLGCDINHNTSVHGIEELFGASYCLSKNFVTYKMIMPEGSYTVDYRRHNIWQSGFAQRYGRLKDVMSSEDYKGGIIHGAQSYLINSPKMWEVGLECLKKNELFFVERMSLN